MKVRSIFATFLGLALWSVAARAQTPDLQQGLRIKYGVEGAVYLEGGRNVGLEKGMHLEVRRRAPGTAQGYTVIAELEVTGLGNTSAVCEIRSVRGTVRIGDIAYLSDADLHMVQRQKQGPPPHSYAQTVTFTDGNPLEDEQRAAVPRPPSPEVNRVRGRIGLESSMIMPKDGVSPGSKQLALVIRADMTRIAGTYWNFTGYWRGRLSSHDAANQQTLTDLIDRTYHLGFTYNNPNSRFVLGFGRLYVPWATSLSTIDGGYGGIKAGSHVTFGLFAGTTPDPTDWNYNPNRQIGGSLVNVETGSFDGFRYSGTFGMALTRVSWHPERQYGFIENGFFYKHSIALFHSMDTDLLRPDTSGGDSGLAVTRSFLTLRVQPHKRITFDFNHNYFRNQPTFDPRLVGTGLLDKFLFQGLSGGARVELPYRVSVYTTIGRSSRTGDTSYSWNQLYGITLGEIWRTGVRADVRYSKFDSPFGRGQYRALSFSRELAEVFRVEVQAGQQNYVSSVAGQNSGYWVTSQLDWFIGRHYFIGGGYTFYRAQTQRYDQWFTNMGYRF